MTGPAYELNRDDYVRVSGELFPVGDVPTVSDLEQEAAENRRLAELISSGVPWRRALEMVASGDDTGGDVPGGDA